MAVSPRTAGSGIDRFTLAAIAVLSLDLIFGGATQPDAVSSLVARLVSMPLLVAAVWRLRGVRLSGEARAGLWLLAAVIAVPMLQSIPLPPSLWEQLPGRAAIAADYAATGIPPPWVPISLTPFETQDVLPWLVPPCAMFLTGMSLRGRGRTAVCLAVPVVAVIAVALGLMQVLGGPESALRFYASTNLDSAVGFFANRNHQAALLVVALALSPLWVAVAARRAGGNAWLGAAVAAAFQVLLVVGIGVTRSRAGVLIGLAVIPASGLITIRWSANRSTRRAGLTLLAAALVGAALVGIFARGALVERFHAPLTTELRVQAAPTVLRAAAEYFPIGSGLGSFDPVYRAVEPLGAVTASYFNHAHNDLLELAVETGALGLVLVGLFGVWWLWTSARIVLGRLGGSDGVAAAASLVVAALLAHSLVDYPLRTTALASVFALACGIMAGSFSDVRRSDR